MDNISSDETNLRSQIVQAREKAVIASLCEPRAESAYYERDSGRIVIHLQHGAIFSFPAELGQELAGATPNDLAAVEVTPSGMGLHWELLDADLSVPALLNGIYGNSAWIIQLQQLSLPSDNAR